MGLFGRLTKRGNAKAKQAKNDRKKLSSTSSESRDYDEGHQEEEVLSADVHEKQSQPVSSFENPKDSEDEDMQREEHHENVTKPMDWREEMLEDQKSRECDAMLVDRFIKKQRVAYFHKQTEIWHQEAHVIAVHLDDGPDHPYYTIKYERQNRDGKAETLEKQTTRDRLQYVLWEDDKSWPLLDPASR